VLSLHAAHSPGETRVVLLQDDAPVEFYIDRPAAPDGFGALYWARVIARVPAMAGAFVALPDAEAFLPDTEGAADVGAGAHLAVRVTRAALGGKGPRVTARISPAELSLGGAGGVRLLRPGPSPLAELRAAFPDAALTEAPFPAWLEADLAGLAEADIALPGGLRASIVPTPALTAIDLDSAAATAARGAKQGVQFAANRDALPALARHIRLRNLSGAILVDLCGLAARKRARLAPDFARALAPDRIGPRLMGFSALGFAEILRPRLRPPLHERLAGAHAAGLAALRQVAAEAAAQPGHRFALHAGAEIIGALAADRAALAALAHILAYPLALRSEAHMSPGKWRIEAVPG
jgi:hypothetical protein